jgi:transcriptional regulator with XRE-family HTH domain
MSRNSTDCREIPIILFENREKSSKIISVHPNNRLKVEGIMKDPTEFKKSVGQKIKVARERLGLTQEELAQKIGKTADAISTYERGTRMIPFEDLPVLLEALDVSPIYFFDNGDTRLNELENFTLLCLSQMRPRFREYTVQVVKKILEISLSADKRGYDFDEMSELDFTNKVFVSAVNFFMGAVGLLHIKSDTMEKLVDRVLTLEEEKKNKR